MIHGYNFGTSLEDVLAKYKKTRTTSTATTTKGLPPPQSPPVQVPSELLDALLAGRCILFLGAGASREASAPGWRRLIDDLCLKFCPKHFDRIEKYFSRLDPWGAADLICNNAPRPEIEVFVRDTLEPCSPSEAHRSITNVSWASIYTTNYDTLVEQAYHEKLSTRRQEPRPVYQFSTDYNIHNNANVHILKLHGSIDQIHHKENVLVLTTKDVTDTRTVRMTMLSNIPRLLLDYYWLFIGYSFTDGVLRQLLAEVRKSNRDSMPRASFALLPKVTDEDRDFFDQYKIQIIPGTMAPFMATIQEHIDREASGKQRIRRIPDIVQTGGRDLQFPAATRVAMDDQFEFVGPADPDYDPATFLYGGEPSWGNLAAAMDFRRDVVTNAIKEQIREAIREAPLKGLIISGAAGSGKSTILRRVGHEVSTDREHPFVVVLLRDFYSAGNRYSETWDWRLISDISQAAENTPVLVLVDNVEVYHRNGPKSLLGSQVTQCPCCDSRRGSSAGLVKHHRGSSNARIRPSWSAR